MAWNLVVVKCRVDVGLVSRVKDSLRMRPSCRVLTFGLGLRLSMLARTTVSCLLSRIRVSY